MSLYLYTHKLKLLAYYLNTYKLCKEWYYVLYLKLQNQVFVYVRQFIFKYTKKSLLIAIYKKP